MHTETHTHMHAHAYTTEINLLFREVCKCSPSWYGYKVAECTAQRGLCAQLSAAEYIV